MYVHCRNVRKYRKKKKITHPGLTAQMNDFVRERHLLRHGYRRPEDNVPVLPFHREGSGDQTQVTKNGRKPPYLLSHLVTLFPTVEVL